MPPMRTAVVSDLHLGGRPGRTSRATARCARRSSRRVSGADRIVLLGDVLELRERPLAESLEVARPVFERARRGARRPPGGARARQPRPRAWPSPGWRACGSTRAALPTETEWPVEPEEGAAGRIAALDAGRGADARLSRAPSARRRLRHPRPLPRPSPHDPAARVDRGVGDGARDGARQVVAARPPTTRRCWPRSTRSTPASPRAPRRRRSRAAATSRATCGGAAERPDGRPRSACGRFLLGRVTIPGAVAALNGLGLGPFRATLTGEELRRAGLLAMARVADGAGAGRRARDLRPHPPPRPAARRRAGRVDHPRPAPSSGTPAAGSTRGRSSRPAAESPYWPGTVLTLDDEGPPRLENVLAGLSGAGRRLTPLPAAPPVATRSRAPARTRPRRTRACAGGTARCTWARAPSCGRFGRCSSSCSRR